MYGNDSVFSNYIKVQFSIRSSIMIEVLSYGFAAVSGFFTASMLCVDSYVLELIALPAFLF